MSFLSFFCLPQGRRKRTLTRKSPCTQGTVAHDTGGEREGEEGGGGKGGRGRGREGEGREEEGGEGGEGREEEGRGRGGRTECGDWRMRGRDLLAALICV